MSTKTIIVLTLFSLIMVGCSREPEKDITFSSLLSDMTNISVFAETPLGEAGMISSYDRKGANKDWANFSSAKDGGFFIIADLKGPGVIRRIWQTSIPAPFKWLFYFDGEETPGLILDNENMFKGTAPFCLPLSTSENGAACSYVPIPYEKSLTIRIKLEKVQKDSRPFFQINYETFPLNTTVETFNPKLDAEELQLAKKVCNFWNGLSFIIPDNISPELHKNFIIKPKQTVCVMDKQQTGTLKSFAVKLSNLPESYIARSRVLRALWLRIYWDDLKDPSVEVPLGDFFCNGLSKRRFTSLPIRVTDQWFECAFPMPFSKRAKIEITNYSNKDVNLSFKAFISENKDKRHNWFHAVWNHDLKSTNRYYQVLSTTGSGHFAGCYVTTISMDGSWHNLEGDDLFIIDKTTKLKGTGLEDYFNGGWYYKGILHRPLHGVTDKAAMRTSQYRFHLTTPIKFNKSLDFMFEFGDEDLEKGYMSSVAYWYQNTPGPSRITIDPNDRRWLPPIDAFAEDAMMVELLELERTGKLDECIERSGYFAEILKQNGTIYKLRELAYISEVSGFQTVSNQIAELKTNLSENSQDFKEAKLIEWLNQSPTNAILSFMSGADLTVYLDNIEIGKNTNQVTLASFPITILPGEHTFRAEITPKEENKAHGFLLTLKTQTKSITSDSKWEYTIIKPANWPQENEDNNIWTPIYSSSRTLPTIYWWQLKPNAMVMTQSGKQIIIPWSGWEKSNKTTYLRRKFKY